MIIMRTIRYCIWKSISDKIHIIIISLSIVFVSPNLSEVIPIRIPPKTPEITIIAEIIFAHSTAIPLAVNKVGVKDIRVTRHISRNVIKRRNGNKFFIIVKRENVFLFFLTTLVILWFLLSIRLSILGSDIVSAAQKKKTYLQFKKKISTLDETKTIGPAAVPADIFNP